jgi:hypothetical protein
MRISALGTEKDRMMECPFSDPVEGVDSRCGRHCPLLVLSLRAWDPDTGEITSGDIVLNCSPTHLSYELVNEPKNDD